MQCRLLSASIPVHRSAAVLPTRLATLPRCYAPARVIVNRRIPSITPTSAARSFLTSRPVLSTAPSPNAAPDANARDASEPSKAEEQQDAEANAVPTDAKASKKLTPSTSIRPTYKEAEDPDFRPYGSATRRSLRGYRSSRFGKDETSDKPSNSQNNRSGSPFMGDFFKDAKSGSQQGSQNDAAIPWWFYEKNTYDEAKLKESLKDMQLLVGKPPSQDAEVKPEGQSTASSDSAPTPDKSTPSSEANSQSPIPRYTMDTLHYTEILLMLKASLRHSARGASPEHNKVLSQLMLLYPADDGLTFLDNVVRKLAADADANLITIDENDIASIAQMLVDTNARSSPDGTSSYHNGSVGDMQIPGMAWLGYELNKTQLEKWRDPEETGQEELRQREEEDEHGDEFVDDEVAESAPTHRIGLAGLPKLFPLDKLFGSGVGKIGFGTLTLDGQPSRSGSESQGAPDLDLFLSKMIGAGQRFGAPRQTESVNKSQDGSSTSAPEPHKKDLVIHVRGYADIYRRPEGAYFLKALHTRIVKRRSAGQRILLLSTDSIKAPKHVLSLGKAAPRAIESRVHNEDLPHGTDIFARSMVVVPDMDKAQIEKVFAEDEKKRIRDVNLRHLRESFIVNASADRLDSAVIKGDDLGVDQETLDKAKVSDAFWPYRRVHKITSIALGLHISKANGALIGPAEIKEALDLCEDVDASKGEFFSQFFDSVAQTTTKTGRGTGEGQAEPTVAEKQREKRLKEIDNSCNAHEKKLFGGVVDAKNIRTTFGDVHVPTDTKEALRTLTSLSLIRPDAFTYGVLATDKIPGLLLYGPPGTGKTMLAKAVAKQSGATVLEVSGSEVYDMYVGEGEKNIKAIFSLAKKLSPCVVFIDEADAIFGMRSSHKSGGSHRELINQFLREWDGMEDMSAFIMVATNRPFDLDDAVLRRLPRKLLVDLPTEKDREQILRIHLKDEQLSEDVDLADLAKRTPFYSGSDLKNVCVAAALACVREEMDAVQKSLEGSSESAASSSSATPSSTQETTTSTPTQADSPSQSGSSDQASTQGGSEQPAQTDAKESEAKPKYPERRILRPHHFSKALEEISASISEDMSSLNEIKKFDEKYGDKRSRRKKTRSWGFGTVDESKKDSVRVRD